MKTSTPRLAEMLDARAEADFSPSFNIAPTQAVPVCLDRDRQRELRLMRWGLVPRWSKDGKSAYNLINARAETLREKPTFREPFRLRRCVLPADGYFEWQKTDSGRKQPWYFSAADGQPLWFAGLWEHWRGAEHEIFSCTIVTTAANAATAPVHHRMPVILETAALNEWLDPRPAQSENLTALLRPCDNGRLRSWPVSTRVNNARNDSPECIQALT